MSEAYLDLRPSAAGLLGLGQAQWSSGRILALGARDPRFEPGLGPHSFLSFPADSGEVRSIIISQTTEVLMTNNI